MISIRNTIQTISVRSVIRAATAGDAEAIARVHTLSWQLTYQGIMSKDFLDGLQWETRFESWNKILSDPRPDSSSIFVSTTIDGAVNGFASIGEVRDEDLRPQKFFELYAIYVAPEYWDLGFGKALLNAALTSVPSGTAGVSLWVLTQNERGRRFYERRGFEFGGIHRIEQIGGRDLEEMRYILPGSRFSAKD